MAHVFYNPNPDGRFVGDCTIRAICKLLDEPWDKVYANTSFRTQIAAIRSITAAAAISKGGDRDGGMDKRRRSDGKPR